MNGAVFKFGGSLADTAGGVLAVLDKAGIPALVVPGGGVFADAVRRINPDDDTAHWMAISAMNRYGIFLASFGYSFTEDLRMPERGISIFLPERVIIERDPLPHSWDVTSDSIALWVSDALRMPLVLLKSRSGAVSDTEFVDPFFATLMDKTGGEVFAVNARDEVAFAAFLADG